MLLSGGTLDIAFALARLFSGDSSLRDFEFEHPDRQALVSLLSFLLGTTLDRFADRIGARRRIWLVMASMLQALCLMSAALVAWRSRESVYESEQTGPSWISPLGLAALGFCSASLGIQVSCHRSTEEKSWADWEPSALSGGV